MNIEIIESSREIDWEITSQFKVNIDGIKYWCRYVDAPNNSDVLIYVEGMAWCNRHDVPELNEIYEVIDKLIDGGWLDTEGVVDEAELDYNDNKYE